MVEPELRGRASRWISRTIGGRGWVELVALWIVLTLTSTLMTARLAHAATDASPTPVSVLMGAGVAALLALVGVGGTVWSWARNGGRPAQRLGRQAWRSSRLPELIGQRVLALSDLQRRRRLLQRRTPQIVVTLVWLVITAMQVGIDHSLGNIAVWTVVFGSFLYTGIRDSLDRRHLPELDVLLGESTPSTASQMPARAAL